MNMATATGVSTAQVAAQLETIVARDASASARAVAVRSAARQPWPERISARGRPFEVRWCDSLLGLREALLGLEPQGASGGGPDEAGVVLLTPFATHELPDDVAARLFKSRVWQPEGWERRWSLMSSICCIAEWIKQWHCRISAESEM